jgi:hypothetical protein
MSVISGGIFSKPRGKTGGIVFGAARTRNGKLATARELVKPSNPNTAGQQEQRNKFKSVLALVRRIGASIYQSAWNRSIGQLPGFQSLMSILLGQIDSSFDITLVTEINLGTLHFPDTLTVTSVETGKIQSAFSSELGSNGTTADKVQMLAFAQTDANRALSNGVKLVSTETRSDEETEVADCIVGAVYEVYMYFIGAGTADGIYSVAKPFEVTISA